MKRLLVAHMLTLCVLTTHAAAVYIPDGFVNGHTFMSYPPNQQAAYMMGVTDGMLAGAPLGGSDKLGQHIKQCMGVLGGNSQTLLTAVRIYLNTHLDEWSYGMHLTFYRVILQNCPLPTDMVK